MKTYHGSCHCGELRFEVDIDLAQGTIRCNCSICAKTRLWSAVVQPAAFRLLAGHGALQKYQFKRMVDQHMFCRHCGVRPFCIGDSPRRGAFYAVNLSCLDNVTAEELITAPITYLDGKNDNWDAPPAEVRHL